MSEIENFLSFYNIGLSAFILIISIYILFSMSSTPIEKKNVNIKVTLKQKIEYLQRTYHRLGQTDNWKAMDKLGYKFKSSNPLIKKCHNIVK